MNFNEYFLNIFQFCKYYNNIDKAINVGDPMAMSLKMAQKQIASHFNSFLISRKLDSSYKVFISKGQPSLPRIPWIAIVRKPGKVYNSLSVTICFGRHGNGVVIGLMKPVESDRFQLDAIERKQGPDFIDLNSNKASTSYNSRFINPTELRPNDISAVVVEKIILNSLEMEYKLSFN